MPTRTKATTEPKPEDTRPLAERLTAPDEPDDTPPESEQTADGAVEVDLGLEEVADHSASAGKMVVATPEAPKPAVFSLAQSMGLGKVFVESGLFKDVRAASQAVVKMMAGQEMGFPPLASMTGIHIIEGKITIGGNLMAAAVKRSGRYDYRVRRWDSEGCAIEFYDRGDLLGSSEFTKDDATRAGLLRKDVWQKYPRNMYFNRAMSNGTRIYCPEVLGGSPVYTPEELDVEVNEVGDVVETSARAASLATTTSVQSGGAPTCSKGVRMELKEWPNGNKGWVCHHQVNGKWHNEGKPYVQQKNSPPPASPPPPAVPESMDGPVEADFTPEEDRIFAPDPQGDMAKDEVFREQSHDDDPFGDMPTTSTEPAADDSSEPSVDDFMLAYRAMRGRFQVDLLPIIGEQYDPHVPDTASDESRKAAWRTTLTKWKRADPSHSFRKILDDHAESVAAAVRAAKGEAS